MRTRLRCPCGELLIAPDEDTLVEMAEQHLVSEHPKLAGEYTREQILSMAYEPLRRPETAG